MPSLPRRVRRGSCHRCLPPPLPPSIAGSSGWPSDSRTCVSGPARADASLRTTHDLRKGNPQRDPGQHPQRPVHRRPVHDWTTDRPINPWMLTASPPSEGGHPLSPARLSFRCGTRSSRPSRPKGRRCTAVCLDRLNRVAVSASFSGRRQRIEDTQQVAAADSGHFTPCQ